jgi:GTP cyclohydrolase I
LEDLLGDEHISTSADTPLRADAFEMDDKTKMLKARTKLVFKI